MLELWGMQSTPSLPSLPGPLWPGVVAPDKGPIYGLHKMDLALNNLQRLICHKTQQTKPNHKKSLTHISQKYHSHLHEKLHMHIHKLYNIKVYAFAYACLKSDILHIYWIGLSF